MPAYPNRPFSDSCVSRDVSRDIARESNSYMALDGKGKNQIRETRYRPEPRKYRFPSLITEVASAKNGREV